MKDETPYHHPYSMIHVPSLFTFFWQCSNIVRPFSKLNACKNRRHERSEEEAWEAYASKLEHAFELCRWTFVWMSIAKMLIAEILCLTLLITEWKFLWNVNKDGFS